jgi:phosphate ABC transporter phosphate-binding protein
MSRLTRAVVAFVAVVAAFIGVVAAGGPVGATAYVPIYGEGSSWSFGAINQWAIDEQSAGMRVNYTANGSTQGRLDWINGITDFAASDIPFQTDPQDGSAPEHPQPGSYAYMPITAGGTVFMYNLKINGQQVTNLRLSGANIAKIFTGQITNWDDPAIAADNPALKLPDETIVPVVRSDGAGSSYQLSAWMLSQYPSVWNSYCQATGRAPACGATSFWPTGADPSMIAQNGDLGVSSYVSQNYAAGSIGYVNYYYALTTNFPVALMLNSAGYYTEPTPQNVAVSLLSAQVDTTDVNNPALYLTQKLQGVYTDPDPRTYPLSAYSYLILPTTVAGQFNAAKGATLAAFSYFAMCAGQQQVSVLGYSPLPANLVEAAFNQIAKIPGAVVQQLNIQSCNNPTFNSAAGFNVNYLAQTAPYPPACDKQGPTQCVNGTGGAAAATAVTGSASAGVTSAPVAAAGVSTPGSAAASTSSTVPVGSAAASLCHVVAQVACPVSSGEAGLGPPKPITALLTVHTGWGPVQTALAIATAGLLVLILLPAMLVRWLGRRRARRSWP